MKRPPLEVADILLAHADSYIACAQGEVTDAQRRVIRQLTRCRTAELGGHVRVCDECEHEQIAYNSCRDRHCPKCQGGKQAAWLQARSEDLLDVEYFHVVFTLPEDLRPIALQNRKMLYGILFAAASQTLVEIAADPVHLGAQIGITAVLHTWGQTLGYHPHLHCIVPGGGIGAEGDWVSCRPGFFLPVAVLGKKFRGKFLQLLRKAHDSGQLRFGGGISELVDPSNFSALIDRCFRHKWVVYSKRPFGGPTVVLKYLARYTHRIAISNSRLVSMRGDEVTFSWKDYASGGQHRETTLHAHEFIRRFLMHLLPKGFVRIRHYGLLANRYRREKIAQCRALLEHLPSQEGDQFDQALLDIAPFVLDLCPQCKRGHLTPTRILHPTPPRAAVHLALVPT